MEFPTALASIAMAPGVLDMLTVLPIDQIETGGINWVKRQIKQRYRNDSIVYSRSKWRIFWAYLNRTWLYDPALWNVHGLSGRLVARTNNPLERAEQCILHAAPKFGIVRDHH